MKTLTLIFAFALIFGACKKKTTEPVKITENVTYEVKSVDKATKVVRYGYDKMEFKKTIETEGTIELMVPLGEHNFFLYVDSDTLTRNNIAIYRTNVYPDKYGKYCFYQANYNSCGKYDQYITLVAHLWSL